MSHCQKWKEGKKRYSKNDSIWGKAVLAEFYKELFAGNPGLLAEELAALEKSLEKSAETENSAETESEERAAGGV